MARDIALIEPDPRDWGGWVIYLLKQMEEEARLRRQRFVSVLRVIVHEIQDMTKRK